MKRTYAMLMGAVFAMFMASGTVYAEGSVSRAQFTSKVENREPVDNLTTLSNDVNMVYFFTDLRGMAGQTVTHRWMYNGNVMAEVPFNVGGARWRVYSSKNFVPEWVGSWTVEVVDGSGSVVASGELNYTGAMAPAAAPMQ